jgi:CheY-like chemotaxis protein
MKKKILLVDDVKLFIKLEETFFRRTGCEILVANSGEEAVKIAREGQPDLILLDFIMPDMMGDEVCRRLKAETDTKKIPIMIVSTSASKEDIDRCFAAGAMDYVTKPINAQEVLAKAAHILQVPQRVHSRFAVNIKVEGEAMARSFTGTSRNISQGGLLLECGEPIKDGVHLSLELPINPDQSSLAFHGEAVRSDPDQLTNLSLVAIKFTDVTAKQEQALAAFISRNNKIPVV